MLELILESKNPARKQEIAERINQSSEQFKMFLEDLFDSEGERTGIKGLVLDLVDYLSSTNAIEVVKRAINDTNRNVRIRGLQATYRRQFDSLNSYIVQLLLNPEEPFEIRKWAIHILGKTDPIAYARYLRKIMRDASQDIPVRKEAIFALTHNPSGITIGALCSLLGDENAEIRQASAWALGKIGSNLSVDCLLAALEDVNETVREWAIRGLRDSDNARALQGLAEAMLNLESDLQQQLLRLVVEKRSEVILRAITELLDSSDKEVRKLAAWALGVSPYPPAACALEKLLQDEDEQVKAYAKKALERLGRFDPADFGLIL